MTSLSLKAVSLCVLWSDPPVARAFWTVVYAFDLYTRNGSVCICGCMSEWVWAQPAVGFTQSNIFSFFDTFGNHHHLRLDVATGELHPPPGFTRVQRAPPDQYRYHRGNRESLLFYAHIPVEPLFPVATLNLACPPSCSTRVVLHGALHWCRSRREPVSLPPPILYWYPMYKPEHFDVMHLLSFCFLCTRTVVETVERDVVRWLLHLACWRFLPHRIESIEGGSLGLGAYWDLSAMCMWVLLA